MTFTLKPLSAGDSEAAAKVHGLCFEIDPWPAAAFEALLACQSQGFSLWNGNVMAGLILFRPAADEAEILTFAVTPAYRRQGAGQALLVHGMAALARQSIRRVFLEVAVDNYPACALYKKMGFETIAERAGYYPGTDGVKAAHVMACNLSCGDGK